jgi:uncharacterized protein (DUF697 family)
MNQTTPKKPIDLFNSLTNLPIISAGIKRAGIQGVIWAEKLKKKYPTESSDELIEKLIQSAMWRTAGTGAASSLGGVFSLAAGGGDLLYFLYAEVELAAAILSIFEINISEESQQPLLLAAVLGLSINELLKMAGGRIGERAINRLAQRRALRTVVNRGGWSVGRLVPIGGAIVGGALNAVMIRGAGLAVKEFAGRYKKEREEHEKVEIVEVKLLD